MTEEQYQKALIKISQEVKGVKKRMLIAEILASLGLILLFVLLFTAPAYWFLGTFLMLPNLYFKIKYPF